MVDGVCLERGNNEAITRQGLALGTSLWHTDYIDDADVVLCLLFFLGPTDYTDCTDDALHKCYFCHADDVVRKIT